MRTTAQSLVLAFDQGFMTLAVVFAFTLVLVFFLRRPRIGGGAPGGH
jgi:hypothetical protein